MSRSIEYSTKQGNSDIICNGFVSESSCTDLASNRLMLCSVGDTIWALPDKNTQMQRKIHINIVGRENTRKIYKYTEKYTQANTFLRPDRRPSPPQEYY